MNDCTCNPPRAKLACRVCRKKVCRCRMSARFAANGDVERFCDDCSFKHGSSIGAAYQAEHDAIAAAADAREKALDELREAT